MPNSFTKRISTALIGIAILSSCSRPVAYFQRGPVESYVSPTTQTEGLIATAQTIDVPTDLAVQANATVSQIEAYVRQDNRLVGNKKLSERMVRVKNLLGSTAGALNPKGTQATRRMNVVQRLMLAKMNSRIEHQLAPNHPEKALIKTGQLVGSIVLLIAGLVLLIAGTGTVAFIGLIVALIGALGTIISLIGIDS